MLVMVVDISIDGMIALKIRNSNGLLINIKYLPKYDISPF